MALLNAVSATGGHPRVPPPSIYVDIFQPGDFGPFVVEVTDPNGDSDKPICANRLPSDYSMAPYTQTARLLESTKGLGEAMMAGAEWKKSARYQDMVRYGRKLYADLFGASDAFSRYVKRSKHLQNGFHILLRLFNTASELWNVPWEYAHDGEMFLVGERGWAMTRTLRDVRLEDERVPSGTLPRPLHILVVLSDPADEVSVNLDEEVVNIRASLKEAEARGLVTVDFVEEATLRNLDLALTERKYHVIHYNGHGSITSKGSCLVMEDEDGRAKPAYSTDLLPILRDHPSLRLIILSACKTGQINEAAAASGIATGLLTLVPAVLTMQFSVTVSGARAFSTAFYGTLAQGGTIEDAVHGGRLAMQNASEQKIDWGMPALYIQRSGLRLIDPQSPPIPREVTEFDLEALPKPKVFVGRRDEQRDLRACLPQLNVASAYIWGLPGIGKSALVRRIIERPGRTGILTDVCVVDCSTASPRELLDQLTVFVSKHFPKAEDILRNPLMPADVRIAEASTIVRGKRLVLVLDRFDALLSVDSDDVGVISNRQLNDFFVALASAPWSVFTIFTSRRYWNALPELIRRRTASVHLHELMVDEVGALFSQLDHLRRVPPAGLNVLLQSIGGHLGTLHLIDTAIARDPSRAGRVDEAFVRGLLARLEADWLAGVLHGLSQSDVNILTAVSFLNRGFWSEHVKFVARLPNNAAAEEIMVRWEMRGVCDFLFNDDNDEPWYAIPTVVRAMLFNRQSEDVRRRLHLRAAETQQHVFYKSALRMSDSGGAEAPMDDTFGTALDYLRYSVSHAPIQIRERIIGRALDWRYHWIEAGHPEHAAAIVDAIWQEMVYTFGQVQEAEALLQESLKATKGREALRVRASLVSLAARQGKTEAAFEQYGMLAGAFAKAGDYRSQAEMLSSQSRLLGEKNLKRAIQLEQEALQLRVSQNLYGAAAESHRTLCGYKQQQKDVDGAVRHVEQAWTLAEKSGNFGVMASVLLSRGSLLLRLNNLREAARTLELAIQYAEQIGDLQILASSISEFSEIHFQLGNYDPAAQYLLDAIELGERLQDYRAVALRLYQLANTYLAIRAYADAIAMADRAMELARRHRPELVADIQTLQKQIRKGDSAGTPHPVVHRQPGSPL